MTFGAFCAILTQQYLIAGTGLLVYLVRNKPEERKLTVFISRAVETQWILFSTKDIRDSGDKGIYLLESPFDRRQICNNRSQSAFTLRGEIIFAISSERRLKQ